MQIALMELIWAFGKVGSPLILILKLNTQVHHTTDKDILFLLNSMVKQ